LTHVEIFQKWPSMPMPMFSHETCKDTTWNNSEREDRWGIGLDRIEFLRREGISNIDSCGEVWNLAMASKNPCMSGWAWRRIFL